MGEPPCFGRKVSHSIKLKVAKNRSAAKHFIITKKSVVWKVERMGKARSFLFTFQNSVLLKMAPNGLKVGS